MSLWMFSNYVPLAWLSDMGAFVSCKSLYDDIRNMHAGNKKALQNWYNMTKLYKSLIYVLLLGYIRILLRN